VSVYYVIQFYYLVMLLRLFVEVMNVFFLSWGEGISVYSLSNVIGLLC